MKKNNHSSIVFLPVCRNCMNIIWNKVDCQQSVENACDNPKILGAHYDIYPARCPHCKAWIDAIVMPTKLPFDSTEHM